MTANNQSAVKVVLGGQVATNGTFTVPYPTGKSLADFENAVGHYFLAVGAKFTQPDDFTIAFGANAATITYKGATTLPGNTEIYVQLEEVGQAAPKVGLVNDGKDKVRIDQLRKLELYQIDLGAPATSDDDFILNDASADDAASEITVFLNSVLDVPRNLIATGTAGSNHVVTVTGKDQYGMTVVEDLTLNGVNVIAGKKAFKSVSKVNVAAGAADDTFDLGFGDVLGLPVFLPSGGYVHSELQDGAAVANAGTLVAGLAPNTISTATTADIRGTYDPNAACDGAKSFSLIVTLPDPTYLGNGQYAG